MPSARSLAELPNHIVQEITQHLSLQSITNLRASTRSFAGQPTDQLLTALRLPLRGMDLHVQHARGQRLRAMTCLTRVVLLQRLGGDDSDAEDLGNEDSPEREPCRHQRDQTALLMTRHVMSLPLLTTLEIEGLAFDNVMAAVSCLAAARPTLTTLKLSDIYKPDTPADAAGNPSEYNLLWAALAAASSLRTLELQDMFFCYDDLAELDELTQLQSLRFIDVDVHDCDDFFKLPALAVSQLTALTELKLWVGSSGRTLGADLHKHALPIDGLPLLTNLRSLHLSDTRNGYKPLAANELSLLQDLTALTALTRLELPSFAEVWPTPILRSLGPCVLPALAALDLSSHIVDLADVTPLAQLTSLQCARLRMAPAPIDVCLPRLRSLSCELIQPPVGFAIPVATTGCRTTPFAVAFPALETLHLSDCENRRSETVSAWHAALWPATHKLPHLSFLRVDGGAPALPEPLAAACCTAMFRTLELGQASEVHAKLPLGWLGHFVRTLHMTPHNDAELVLTVSVCPNVESLHLFCDDSDVSDAGLTIISKLARRLREVHIESMVDDLSVDGLAALAAIPTLEQIRLVLCCCFSEDEVQYVQAVAQRSGLVIHATHADRNAWWGSH